MTKDLISSVAAKLRFPNCRNQTHPRQNMPVTSSGSFRSSLSRGLVFHSLALILILSSTLTQAHTEDASYASTSTLRYLPLSRFKRQQSGPPSNQLSGGSSGQQAGGATTTGSPNEGPAATGSQDAGSDGSQDEKPPDEAVSSLKCDFGSADGPDLCKFKILESDNPLSKGMNSWTHGSGRLALFQGGPLMDASAGNDTSGGYIFYETSNPFTGSANQTSASPLGQQLFGDGQPQGSHHRNYGLAHDEYSAFMKSSSHNRHKSDSRHTNSAEMFQHVSSARVSVATPSVGSQPNSLGPAFMTPNLTAPGPSGMCLSFQYAIQGLSAEELRIHVNDKKTERHRQIWASSESSGSNWTKGEVLYSVTNIHSLVFSASGSSSTPKDLQQRKFRGYIALDEIEINKHDTSGGEGPCRGHCNFDGDLCGWTNGENGQDDDFDWTLGRGSDNLFTGPARDFVSSTNNEPTGSYLNIDSGYPRRPGDKATLMSPMFQQTAVNDAMCMKFAVHMFGSGIGSLAIKIRYADDSGGGGGGSGPPVAAGGSPGDPNQANGPTTGAQSAASRPSVSSRSDDGKTNNDLVIWEMSGDSGNSWHQAQTSVSSSKGPFQVLVEGVVGENHLGNIAIDEISFSSGPCPTSPPVASKNYGDCTFEQSMCYWRNPDADIHLDDLDWVRSADEQSIHGPNFDHTLKKRSGSYLKLENTFREPKSGTRAFLLSPIFQPKSQGSVQCLSFYYYMFMRSISSSGPNLGTIRVYLASNNELVPIWRLTNPISSPNWKHARASLSTAIVDGQPVAPSKLFQIAFEGIWGDAAGGAIALDDITVFDGACDILPPEAKSVPGECTFDVDMCSWSNKTYDTSSNMDSTDPIRSPFIQSVNSGQAGAHSMSRLTDPTSRRMSWQLATVDSRPVNLQDHTYKAPIGYAYVDVLDSSSQKMAFPLQSSEVTVASGTQVVQCLSFWFAAYGRQDSNQLKIHVTQASAPPPPPEDSGSASPPPPPPRGAQSGSSSVSGAGTVTGPNSQTGANSPPASNSPSNSGNPAESEGENPNAWKAIDGKLVWSVTLSNITESNRRKWLYGQVTLKTDSNHIVRFVAVSNDGGFAIDDISYFDGACVTRPMYAKVQEEEDSGDNGSAPAAPKSTGQQ